jgi:diguanylate cyclase
MAADSEVDVWHSAIVRAIVAMADGLRIGVTALGVETHDQLASLKKLRCGRGQGSYLARPMAAEDLTQLVRESRRWPVD